MIRLPDIPNVPQQGLNMPEVRPGAVAAPALALGQLAESIAGVSDHFFDTALQVQKLENARAVSEKRLALDSAYAQHRIDLQTDPDPASRMTKTAAFLAAQKGNIEDDTLPPAARESLALHFDEFATRATISQAEESAGLAKQRAGLALQTEFQKAGDHATAAGVLERAVESGLILPEQRDSMLAGHDRKQKWNAVLGMIEADPFSASDAMGRADFLKQHPELDADDLRQLQGHAATAVRRQTIDDIETIKDGIAAGQVTRPEDIDAMAGHLRPAVREQLKGDLLTLGSEAEKARRADPEYQARVVGEVSSLLANYRADTEGFDLEFTRMDSMVRTLPPGAVRTELERRMDTVRKVQFDAIDAARKAQLEAVDTAQKLAFKAVDDVFASGRMGTGTQAEAAGMAKKNTASAITDGFLTDSRRWLAMGYSQAQVDAAKQTADQAAASYTLSEAGKTMNKQSPREMELKLTEIKNAALADEFRAGWVSRPDAAKAKPDAYTEAAATAIHENASTFQYADPAMAGTAARERDAALVRKGRVVTALAEWFQAHPKASPLEIERKVLEIGGLAVDDEFMKAKLAPAPKASQSSALPLPTGGVKLSNYGYQSDKTPDKNSAAGIGHANNRLEAGVSAAISKSLADRLGLADGDRVQLETTRGQMIVRYDDTVPAHDSRTGPLPETIDIYRPADGTNDWGGTVISARKL
jgi:hypothetical protein